MTVMNYLYIGIFLLSFALQTGAQIKHDYVWVFGSRSDDPDSKWGTNFMDFNNNELTLTKEVMNMHFFVTNASISDSKGKLLFYTNGCFIHNAFHQLMENGDNLNPGIAYLTGNCPNGGNAVADGAIILPLPGDSTKYYLFHSNAVQGVSGVFSIYTGKLNYTLVDMSLNNGLGAVVEKNQLVIEDTLSGELHAVRHVNGQDWWIVAIRGHENKYMKVLFTEQGITSVTGQKIGMDPDPWSSQGGQAKFSPDGTKFARYTKRDQVFLMDFDRETGELSNFKYLYADSSVIWGGVSFSPNSRYLYVNTRLKLWQFDTEAPDVQESKVLIDEYDGYLYNGHPSFPTTFYLMQLAPDCKIYMVSRNSTDVLHVIHNPDEAGQACNFRQHDLQLAAVTPSSIPNFPNYRLGTPYPVCDSTIQLVTGSVAVLPPAGEVRVWPNPATGSVSVELSLPLAGGGEWWLHTAAGQAVRQVWLPPGETLQAVPLSGLAPGLYFWSLRSGEGRLVGRGKLVVGR